MQIRQYPRVWILSYLLIQALAPSCTNIIIAITEQIVFSAGNCHSGISCRGKATILLMDDFNSLIFFNILVTNSRTIIRATIIHENQFKVRKGLREDTVHTAAKIWLHFINRYNNANFRQSDHLFFSLRFNCSYISLPNTARPKRFGKWINRSIAASLRILATFFLCFSRC